MFYRFDEDVLNEYLKRKRKNTDSLQDVTDNYIHSGSTSYM